MQKKSTTSRPKSTRRTSKPKTDHLQGVLGVFQATRKVYRVGFLITEQEAKAMFDKLLLKREGLRARDFDEIEISVFINRPEKNGGKR